MDNQQATDLEIGWLAGIIDGEGWLGFSVTQDKRPGVGDYRRGICVKTELKITNCDEAIIERATGILQKLGVNPYRRTHKQLGVGRRPVHECAIKHMASIERVLPTMQPHLTGNKQQRAAIMLRFITLRKVNPGFPNPNYSKSEIRPGKPGRQGPGRIKPYTADELTLIEQCRDLQSRGASETTRENRERTFRAMESLHVRVQSS